MWLSKFQEAYESIVNEKNIFNTNSVYHVTSIKNIEIIKKEGLKINQARFFTTDSDEDWVRNAYKCNPIFLATKPNLYKGKDTIELIVDVSGLQIGADLGSLIDKGAILTERGFYFDYNFRRLGYEFPNVDLMEPYFYEKAIPATKTLVCLENIDPSRIKLKETISKIEEKDPSTYKELYVA